MRVWLIAGAALAGALLAMTDIRMDREASFARVTPRAVPHIPAPINPDRGRKLDDM